MTCHKYFNNYDSGLLPGMEDTLGRPLRPMVTQPQLSISIFALAKAYHPLQRSNVPWHLSECGSRDSRHVCQGGATKMVGNCSFPSFSFSFPLIGWLKYFFCLSNNLRIDTPTSSTPVA